MRLRTDDDATLVMATRRGATSSKVHLQRASSKLPCASAESSAEAEGSVSALESAPNLVAKLYLRSPGAAKSEKSRSMVRRATAQLMRVAAWPMDLLLDEQGAVVGFLMRKVSAREDIHELYSPKSRRQKFPNADLRFVVRVATNLARAFGRCMRSAMSSAT